MKSFNLTPDKVSYHTLMKKTKTIEYLLQLFKEMKDNNIQPDVFIFNEILAKVTKSNQPLHVILDLLDEMIQLKIKPNVKEYRNKKGKLVKPHTVLAVQEKLKKCQTPYKKWVAEKREQLKDAPSSLYLSWEEFFNQTTE